MNSHFKEKHEINAEQLSLENIEISSDNFESVQESDLEMQIGNSQLTEDDIHDKEYLDELDVGTNICVECNSNDVANLPGVSQAMTLDLIKKRYADIVEFPDFVITKVSSFAMEESGTDGKMEKSPSQTDDATIRSSDCLLTHIAETGIHVGEDIPTNSKSLLSDTKSIKMEDNGPYYCPDCGKGLGYSINALRSHIGRNKGICKRRKSVRILYTCSYCNTDYSRLRTLERHNTKFGDTCKSWQISMNNRKQLQLLAGAADIPQRVQSMEITDSEPARDYTKLPLPHLITDKDSNPYYCPDCGRCLGYSYKSFQMHVGRYTGHCREKFAGRRLYGCKYCKEEFHELHNLTIHTKRFGDGCKAKQITINKNNIIFNYNGEVKEITSYSGLCKEMPTKRAYYTCQYCKFDYSSVYALRYHNLKFGNRCNLVKKTLNQKKKPKLNKH